MDSPQRAQRRGQRRFHAEQALQKRRQKLQFLRELVQSPVKGTFFRAAFVRKRVRFLLVQQHLFYLRSRVMFVRQHVFQQQGKSPAAGAAAQPSHAEPKFLPLLNNVPLTSAVPVEFRAAARAVCRGRKKGIMLMLFGCPPMF